MERTFSDEETPVDKPELATIAAVSTRANIEFFANNENNMNNEKRRQRYGEEFA